MGFSWVWYRNKSTDHDGTMNKRKQSKQVKSYLPNATRQTECTGGLCSCSLSYLVGTNLVFVPRTVNEPISDFEFRNFWIPARMCGSRSLRFEGFISFSAPGSSSGTKTWPRINTTVWVFGTEIDSSLSKHVRSSLVSHMAILKLPER